MMMHQDPSLRHERRERRLMLALLAPAMLVVAALLIVPLTWLFWQSIYSHGFTFEHYARILDESVYWKTFALTFRISAIVTLAALFMGYPLAYLASSLPQRWSILVLSMVMLPLWTSVLVRTYAWLILLQKTGLVNATLTALGAINEPLPLIHNELGTIIATLHILLPFMVLPLYSTMKKIPNSLLLAGSSLGGGPFHVFRRVFLPLSFQGVIAGATLVFVLCLGFYITPELVGGGTTIMASMVVSRNIQLYVDWGAASAVSVVLLLCVISIFYVVSRLVPVDRIVGAR